MSEVTTENTPDVDQTEGSSNEGSGEKEAPLSLIDRLKAVADGSRVTLAEGEIVSLVERTRDLAKNALAKTRGAGTAVRAWAEGNMDIRTSVMHPNGYPDFGGVTETSKALVAEANDAILGTIDSRERNALTSAYRMAIKRGVMEKYVRRYAAQKLGHEPTTDGIAEAESNPAWKGTVRDVYAHILTDKGETVAVPDAYLTNEQLEEKKRGNAPQKDPASALQSALNAVRGLFPQNGRGGVIPRFTVMVLLYGVSTLVRNITAKDAGAIEERAHVSATLARIADLSTFGALALDGDPGANRDEVAHAFWGADDESYGKVEAL